MTATEPLLQAVRADKIITLAGENPAAGLDALLAPAQELRDAVLVGQGGKIIAVESWGDFQRRPAKAAHQLVDLGMVTLLPGFVNVHNHLELAALPEKPSGGRGFSAWVKSLLQLLHKEGAVLVEGEVSGEQSSRRIVAAVDELADSFVAAVGDVTSRNVLQVAEALLSRGVSAHFFVECFGYSDHFIPPLWQDLPSEWKKQSDGDSSGSMWKASLAGHALYSTALCNLQTAKSWCRRHEQTFSLHLAESEDELEFLTSGRGPLGDLLAERVLPENFTPLGQTPVLAAEATDLLDEHTLAVHCVHCTTQEREILGRRGVFVALCPRSNAYIGVGEASVLGLAESGVRLCLGTDSPASNQDMNFLQEIFALRGVACKQGLELTLPALARIATLNGAAALGLNGCLGRLEQGLRFCYSVVTEEQTKS